MAYFTLYDTKLTDLKSLLSTFDNHLALIEVNILQKDNADVILEKVVSVVVSSVFVTLGSGFAAFFGVVTAGFGGGILLFMIGWLFSQKVNRDVFGTEKDIEKINHEDRVLLCAKDKILAYFKPIKKKLIIKKYRKEVAFTHYPEIKEQLKEFCFLLQNYNVRNLAFKYRVRHNKVIQKNILLMRRFDDVYCH